MAERFASEYQHDMRSVRQVNYYFTAERLCAVLEFRMWIESDLSFGSDRQKWVNERCACCLIILCSVDALWIKEALNIALHTLCARAFSMNKNIHTLWAAQLYCAKFSFVSCAILAIVDAVAAVVADWIHIFFFFFFFVRPAKRPTDINVYAVFLLAPWHMFQCEHTYGNS